MERMDELKDLLSQVMGEDLSQREILPEHRLTDEVGLTSIGLLYMAMAIEQHFGVAFDNRDVTALVTVQDVLDVLERKLGA